jgi:hypothetical protein
MWCVQLERGGNGRVPRFLAGRRVCFPVGKKQVVRSVRRGQGTEGSPNLRAARTAWVFLVGDSSACIFGVGKVKDPFSESDVS